MLAGLRVLDLSDERGLLCGRLLADLGADVVFAEDGTPSPARLAQPMVDGLSMTWESFGANRRGAQMRLDGTDPQFLDLLAVADVVVLSRERQWHVERHLDPAELLRRFPHLVCTVISGFGWSGPKADYHESDLVLWAAGGPLDPHRDGDRPPLRISVPQAYLHAAADAAAGTLVAVLERQRSGLGQIVEASAQTSLGVATLARILADAVGDANPEWHQQVRPADQSGSGAATPAWMKKWPCRDGTIELHLSMGPAAGRFTNNLFAWMADEGAVDGEIARWDWRVMPERIASGEITLEDLDRARAAVRAHLATMTKREVVEAALKHRLLCMAIFDISDVRDSPQLRSRDFWAEVDVKGRTVAIPGRVATIAQDQPQVRRHAPSPGEHTDEVLTQWSGPRPWATGQAPDHTDVRTGSSPAPRAAALADLKVLDLSWVVAGPLIGRALADYGADVIRVESSTRIETARLMQPFYAGESGPENSALFGNCNAGKRGVTVDLSSPQGREVIAELVAWADVVVESFSAGQMHRWGLGYEQLRALKPDLIMVSSSIAGQFGPWAKLAGFGNVGSSVSGLQNLVGWVDGVPLGPFGPYTDYLGPRTGVICLLAALLRRERTGQGCWIDVSQVEAGVYFLSPQLAHFGWDATIATRMGNDDLEYFPHAVLPARADGDRECFVAVAVTNGDQWRALADLLGLPPQWSLAERRGHADVITDALAQWICQRDGADAERILQQAGIPAHRSISSADALTDPQLLHAGHFVRLAHRLHGTAVVEAPRCRLSATPGRVRRPAPTLGQHNQEVLAEVLGYDSARIDQLIQSGVMT
ncbi:MAG: CoA transferase [Actinomycetales bacterium]